MALHTALLPSPHELGLPAHFGAWRPLQDQAVLDAICSDRRFVMSVQPVGAGKSAFYIAAAVLLNARTMVLTRTKALQVQIIQDFERMGLVSVQGMNASRCLALEPGGEHYQMFRGLQSPGRVPGCDDGPCRSGVPCSLRDGGCYYYDSVRAAQQARLVVSNYAYWMYQGRYGKGLGEFDLLVLDEAHEAASAVSDFLAVSLEPWEMHRAGAQPLAGQAAPDQWAEWAAYHSRALELRLADLGAAIKQAHDTGSVAPSHAVRESRELQRIAAKFSSLKAVGAQWVIHEQDRVWTFTPVWPADYAEGALFRGVPKIILTSATVRPKSAVYLGIAAADLDVHEYPSTFPVAARPVIHIPTVRVHHRMTDEDVRVWLQRIDQILASRLDRKGVIHTVSYARARLILKHSRFAASMLVHTSEGGGAKLAVEKFKLARPPCILVSPSVTTGYDFPFDACRFQIVAKVPFPDSRDPLLMARQVFDPEYGMYLTMQTLVQECGRSTRAADDWSEVFVIDDNFGWLIAKYKHLAPSWFLEAVQRRATIPPAPAIGAAGDTGRRTA